MTPAEFAEALRVERLRRRLYGYVLAEQIGVCARTLGSWESGVHQPPREGLQRWAALLGVEVPEDVLQQLRSPCGTEAGYYRHRRKAEPPCQPCKTAHAGNAAVRKGRQLVGAGTPEVGQ